MEELAKAVPRVVVPAVKVVKNTMTEEEKRKLNDYVAHVVISELSPYLKKNIITTKGEFKHIARKLTKEISTREHIRNIDNEQTVQKIREFVKAQMKYFQKQRLAAAADPHVVESTPPPSAD